MKNLWWLSQGSVKALGGVRHGSVSNLSWLWEASVTSRDWLRLLLASLQRWRIPPRAMTDCSQSHDGLLLEPWQTPCRAMTDFSQTHRSYFLNLKKSKTMLKLCQNLYWQTQEEPKLRKKTVSQRGGKAKVARAGSCLHCCQTGW